MMTCQRLAELLLEFMSGELTPEHAAEIQQHLQACPPCVTFVETYQVTITLSRQLPTVPMRPEFARRLEQLLHEWTAQGE